jgi:hypothetical protein
MPSMIQYQLAYDANRHPHGAIVAPSQHVDAYVLAASVAQTVTVPAGARIAVFSCGADFLVNFQGAAAAVPAANITSGAAPELNPTVRDLTGQTSFSVIAETNCILTISYFG